MGSVLIDNWNLNAAQSGVQVIVDKVERSVAVMEEAMQNRSTNDGAVLEGAYYRNPDIEIGFWIIGGTPETRRDFLRGVVVPKTSDKTGHKLQFHDDGVKYYQAIRTGGIKTAENIDSMYVSMSFRSLHPWMFGETHTVQIGTSSTRLTVGGNVITPISGSGTLVSSVNTSCGIRSIWSSNISSLSWKATSGTEYSFQFDSEARTCNQNQLISSAWLYAVPNSVRPTSANLVNASSGSATITYTDRWL